MEIIVLGAGAIGSLYGAKLAAKNDVTLVARAKHADAINGNGLRIEGLESQTVRIRATTAPERIGPNALVLVTTKVPDTAAVLAPIAQLVLDDTTIVSLQNGLHSEKIARRALGSRGVVLRGITQFGAIFKAPGVIQFMARGYTLLEKHDRSEQIAAVLNAAILGCEVGGIANPQLDPLKELVIAECLAVAASQGVILEGNFQQEISDFFRPSHNIASMLQDLRRGRPTEIDYLNGAVIGLGARHNVACPVNAALTAIIKVMEARRTLSSFFSG